MEGAGESMERGTQPQLMMVLGLITVGWCVVAGVDRRPHSRVPGGTLNIKPCTEMRHAWAEAKMAKARVEPGAEAGSGRLRQNS